MPDLTDNKRIHFLDAAGAGDLGAVSAGDVLGPCPSCGAELLETRARDPRTGQVARALLHPVPFCTYFGETDPADIKSVVSRATQRS